MSAPTPDYLIVSLPNTPTSDSALRSLRRACGPNQSYATLHPYTLPALLVGTLDTLMALSDDLGRIDMSIESTVKKIERTYADLVPQAPPLPVNGGTRDSYVSSFEWDYARFPHRRPLPELVKLVAKGVSEGEDEMRTLLAGLQDAQSKLTDLKRSTAGSLLTSSLSISLSPDVLSGVEVLESEYLKTVFVAVSKGQRKEFEVGVYGVGEGIVGYGVEGR